MSTCGSTTLQRCGRSRVTLPRTLPQHLDPRLDSAAAHARLPGLNHRTAVASSEGGAAGGGTSGAARQRSVLLLLFIYLLRFGMLLCRLYCSSSLVYRLYCTVYSSAFYWKRVGRGCKRTPRQDDSNLYHKARVMIRNFPAPRTGLIRAPQSQATWF